MNWKQNAMEQLQAYCALRQSVKSIPLELKLLESETILSAAQDPYGDVRLNNLLRWQRLNRSLEQAKVHTARTEQAFLPLCEEELRVLELFFIKPRWGNVNQLCVELGMSRSTAYRKRDGALRKFALALYGAAV